jgi:hypothetical protein
VHPTHARPWKFAGSAPQLSDKFERLDTTGAQALSVPPFEPCQQRHCWGPVAPIQISTIDTAVNDALGKFACDALDDSHAVPFPQTVLHSFLLLLILFQFLALAKSGSCQVFFASPFLGSALSAIMSVTPTQTSFARPLGGTQCLLCKAIELFCVSTSTGLDLFHCSQPSQIRSCLQWFNPARHC